MCEAAGADHFHHTLFDWHLIPLSMAQVDFECGGKSATIDAKDARRAVLGAVLDAVWAVTPTHRTFGPVHGEIRNNYLSVAEFLFECVRNFGDRDRPPIMVGWVSNAAVFFPAFLSRSSPVIWVG